MPKIAVKPESDAARAQPSRGFAARTVGDILLRNSRWYPDRDAFVLGDRRRTYRALYQRGARLASAFEKQGAVKQDRIGMVSPNSIEHYEFFTACEIAGFIAAPLSFRAAPPELEHLATDSGVSIVLFAASHTALVDAVRAKLPAVRLYVCVPGEAPGEGVPDWALDYETFLAGGDEQPLNRAEPDDIAYLYYTSGTTGRPKGVPLSHRGQLANTANANYPPGSAMLQLSPAFHVGGRGLSLGMYWVAGKVVLSPSFDATQFLELVHSERVTTTFMVPAMVIALLDHPRIDDYDLSSLNMVMLASTTIPTDLLRRALERFGRIFYLAYGSTEGGAVCRLPVNEVHLDGDEAATRRLGSVGHFEPHCDGAILDDDGQPCPVGVVGEVCIFNPPSFRGYWNNDNATRAAMHGTSIFRTGDLGYLDEQGYVFLVDRKKDMLITGGENVYSREVEEAVDRHPAVRESAVIGKPDPKWGESVLAVIVLHPGQTLTEDELIAFARTQIARYKCPRTVIFVDDMPRQATGKTDKMALRRLYAGGN